MLQRVLLGVSGALVTLLIFVQVFTRYVLHISIFGIEDLASFLAVWLYFIGGSLGAWERAHISASLVDFIIKSDRPRRWINAQVAHHDHPLRMDDRLGARIFLVHRPARSDVARDLGCQCPTSRSSCQSGWR